MISLDFTTYKTNFGAFDQFYFIQDNQVAS